MTVTELREALQKLEAEGHGEAIVRCDEPEVIPARPHYHVVRHGFVTTAKNGLFRDIRSGEIVGEDVATEFVDLPEEVSLSAD